jgi:hypothetical protein
MKGKWCIAFALMLTISCSNGHPSDGTHNSQSSAVQATPASDHPKQLDRSSSVAIIAPNLRSVAAADVYGFYVSGGYVPDVISQYLEAHGFLSCKTERFVRSCNVNRSGKKFLAMHAATHSPLPIPYCAPGAHCEPPQRWTIPVADARLDSVDGILKSENHATIDFTYSELPNAFGKSLAAFAKSRKVGCGTDYPARWAVRHTEQIATADYDDGWRYAGLSQAAAMRQFFGPGTLLCGGL